MIERDVFTDEVSGSVEHYEALVSMEVDRIEDVYPPPRTSSVSARQAYARIPDGYELHHLCGNPWCRNHRHLIAVTVEDHKKIHGAQSYCER